MTQNNSTPFASHGITIDGGDGNGVIITGNAIYGSDDGNITVNQAHGEAVERLIALHQNEFDLILDACLVAEELKHRPKPKRYTTTTSTSYNTTTSTTTTSFNATATARNPGWSNRGRPKQPKPRPQPLNALQRIVARFRR